MTTAHKHLAPTHAPDPRPCWRTVATFSRGMFAIPHLAELLGAERVVLRPGDSDAGGIDAVVGWGEKANTEAAIRYARRHDLPYWRAEDGFLRSVGLGAEGEAPLSIVLDDLGIYYDAGRESRLEAILNGTDDRADLLADAGLLERARVAIDRIAAAELSKYNNSPSGPVDLGASGRSGRVLVVDQTRGDLSIVHGMGDAASFAAMLDAALAEHPDAQILVKTHPDVAAGVKRGCFGDLSGRSRVRLLGNALNPIALLQQVDHVYVVTSQLGFEALMLGKQVTCFGVPFYAGWGLTDDRQAVPRRRRARSLEQVFAAAYILYPRYVDPDTGKSCELERVIEHLALQREQFGRNAGTIYCLGFWFWKRNYVRAYLRSPGNRVVFARSARHAERLGFDSSANLLVWGQREDRAVRDLAARHRVSIWRMEDGFLRSVGLGSDLVSPASLVVDRVGIYYDPTGPSELESILCDAEFSAEEVARARALRERIVGVGLSKYNVGQSDELRVPAGKRVILVPGQVEDDASMKLGCRDVCTNAALLAEARKADEDAYIIYKPHPDVVSGNRRGHLAGSAGLEHCDHVETEASLHQCLAVADEVHTLTSLVGFEALLRGLRVVVYGQPFYSSWGLTEDRHPVVRRGRKLTIDQLVAGTLIRYPRYLNRDSGRFSSPEAIVSQLCRERDTGSGQRALRVPWPRRQLRKLVHAYKGMTHAP